MKCIITGKETLDKTRNFPIHKESRTLLEQAKGILKTIALVESNDGLKAMQERGLAIAQQPYELKDMKVSTTEVLDYYREGKQVSELNLPIDTTKLTEEELITFNLTEQARLDAKVMKARTTYELPTEEPLDDVVG